MKWRRRTTTLGAVGFLAIAAAMALPAWACTSAASLRVSGSALGDAGARVRLSGNAFPKAPVEIRWGAVTGPLLATVAGPDLDVQVEIPSSAPPGVHYLVALSREGSETMKAKTAVPFEVLSNGQPVPAAPRQENPMADHNTGSSLSIGVAMLAVGLVATALVMAPIGGRAKARVATR